MASTNSFLQSPFQTLIAQQEEARPLPGAEQVKEAAPLPDLSAAAPVPAGAGISPKLASPSPAAAPTTGNLLPPESLRPLFEATASHFKVPVNVLMAIAHQESRYNPDATNKDTGAAGMAQYIDATAKSLGINARDPNEAVPAAAMQLRERLDKGYSVEDAVKEHFAGPDRKKWGEKTAAYGAEVLAKAGQIGKELYGDTADAPTEPAKAGTPAPDQDTQQNQFAPTRMGKADYEAEFRKLNPRASDAAVKAAMAQYDQQQADAGKAKAAAGAKAAAVKKMAPEQQMTQQFNDRLDARLQGLPNGVVPQLPGNQQPYMPHVQTPLARLNEELRHSLAVEKGEPVAPLPPSNVNPADLEAEMRPRAGGPGTIMTNAVTGLFGTVLGAEATGASLLGMDNAAKELDAARAQGAEAARLNGGDTIVGKTASLAGAIAPAMVSGGANLVGQLAGNAGLFGAAAARDAYREQKAKGASDAVAIEHALAAGGINTALPMIAPGGSRAIAKALGAGDVAGLKAAGVQFGQAAGEGAGFSVANTATHKAIDAANGIQTNDPWVDGKGALSDAAAFMALRAGHMAPHAVDAALDKVAPGYQVGRAMQEDAGNLHFDPATARGIAADRLSAQNYDPRTIAPQETARAPGDVGPSPMARMAPAPGPLTAAVESAAPEGRVEPVLGDAPASPVADAPRAGSPSVADQLRAIRPPAGPLEAAIQDAAEQHAANPAPLPEVPQEAPQPPALDTLPLEDLRAQLKQVAGQAKANPGQRQELMKQRQAIEKEIGARAKQAKADSKPAEEPLKSGPFEDMAAANKMMLRYAEQTGQPHEVVGSDGKFTIKPIGESNGINPAGAARGPDGHGRSGEPADAVGRADAAPGGETGRGADGSRGGAGSEPVAHELPNAGADRTGADGAADAQPALTFKTSKGSTYTVNQDGTTTRDKAARAEHPGEQGAQQASKRTVYMTSDEMAKLAEMQAKGGARKGLVFHDGDKKVAIRYLDGKDEGKIEGRTVASFASEPAVGLHPVESWGDGYTVHFGNEITEINAQPALKGARDAVSKAGKDGAHGAAGMPDAQPGAAVAAGKQGADVAVPAVDAKAAAPALKNPYHTQAFPDQAKAEAFMDKKAVDREQFEAVQTGPVRWQVKPRTVQAPAAEQAKLPTRDTRGTGVRFHGSSRPLPDGRPNNDYAMNGDSRNIYGQGFYTTDAADISEGYMKKGKGGSPTLYEVKERPGTKLFDMEQPMTPEVRKMVERAMGDEFPAEDIDGKPITTMREAFDEYRDESQNNGLTRDEVQETFDAIRYNLEQQGYHGYRHIGGLKTKKTPHDVHIYWTPEDHLDVSQSDLAKYKESADVPQRQEVPEEAPVARGAESTPKADAAATDRVEPQPAAVTSPAPTQVESGGMKAPAKSKGKAAPKDAALSMGKTPNSAEPVTVKDGVIHIGEYPAQDYDTGNDVTVPKGATPQQVKDALVKAGVMGKGTRIFGTEKAEDEGVRYSVSGDQTDTPAFRKWFGKSAVVDKDGKPLVLYHGTNADVSEMKSKGELYPGLPWTRGIYFTADPKYASRYADREGANVMPVYVRMENPKIVTDSGFKTASISKEQIDQLRAEGHDGIINHADDEYIVFDSKQVKSAIGNSGAFDPASPDIRYSTKGDKARDLVITHNLTEANLFHAQKMGGIAVPSLAVTKKDSPLSGFGEITLIGSKAMADPKGYAGTKVFGADIYSPRYPSVEHKLGPTAMKVLNRDLTTAREALGMRELYNDDVRNVRDLSDSPQVRYLVLKDMGVNIEPVRNEDGTVNHWATENVIRRAIGDKDAYAAVEQKARDLLEQAGADERIFNGYSPSGTRKYVPHTLENVVKILKKELRGGENFSYGLGSVRAHYTEQFRTVKAIQAARDRLVSKEDFEKVKNEIQEEFDSLQHDLAHHHPASDRFGFGDTVAMMMSDAAKMGVPRALDENGFDDVPTELRQELGEFLGRLAHLPTEYFEAKIVRDVDLAEFSGAVIPAKASQRVRDLLKSRGIPFKEYASEAERAAAINSFSQELDQKKGDILFSTGHAMADAAPRAVSPLVQSLADKGAIVLHQDASTLPVKGKAPAGVQALTTADGTIHIVANALGDNAAGIVLHEAFHAGTKALIGSAAWDGLNTRLGALYRQGEQTSGAARTFWDAARARVETAKAKGAVAKGMEHEEFGAYAIEEYAKAPLTVRKWVDDLVGAVKAWALRRFGKQMGDVTPAQLSSLAKLALLDAQTVRGAEHQLQPAFSSDSSKTIEVDGQRRPIENSRGQIIAEDMHKQMAFWRWAAGTKVVDAQGRPEVVYHATFRDFSEFRTGGELGAHFGTAEQANALADEPGSRVMPAYLSIQKPLRLEDFGTFRAEKVVPQLIDKGILSPDSKAADYLAPDGINESAEGARKLQDAIKSAGFDGVVYHNTGEGDGDSYIVFDPKQIKSAVGNDGSFSGDTLDIRYSTAGAPATPTVDPTMRERLARTIARPVAGLRSVAHDGAMLVVPMEAGSDKARAMAKEFANNTRAASAQWVAFDTVLKRNYSEQDLAAMWHAADQENDLRREGRTSTTQGLASLPADQRETVELLHAYGEQLWERAKRAGLVADDSEGVHYWTPRVAANIYADGSVDSIRQPGEFSKDAKNLRTSASSTKQRRHETTAESEAALKEKLGDDAEYVKNIRVMPMAMAQLEKAIAGRTLVNQIRAHGQMAGQELISETGGPNFATFDHPALKRYIPKMDWHPVDQAVLAARGYDLQPDGVYRNGEKLVSYRIKADGTVEQLKPMMDSDGNAVLLPAPLFVHKDFAGPLRAVFTSSLGNEAVDKVYRGAMQLKGTSMSMIMVSPMTHNAVIWGKAMPSLLTSMGWKSNLKNLATAGAYTYVVGHQFRKDHALVNELIQGGLVPIGGRGMNPDIQAIADGIKPGRSLLAKALGAVLDPVSPKAGDMARKGVDALGHFWHETLLWDRIGDMQVGMAVQMRNHFMDAGIDQYSATRIAAHFANRYAGAIPQEAMSQGAHALLNMTLFSKSFTMTNLGAMKDPFVGLPADVRAQIKEHAAALNRALGKTDIEAEDAAGKVLKQAQSATRKKAAVILMADFGAMAVITSLAQAYFKSQSGDEFLKDLQERLHALGVKLDAENPLSFMGPTWGKAGLPAAFLRHPFENLGMLSQTHDNPHGKQDRIRVGEDEHGNTYYMRLPVGKVVEEMKSYTNLSTASMLADNKFSPLVKGVLEAKQNRDFQGRTVYDKHAYLPVQVAQAVGHILKAQVPFDDIVALKNVFNQKEGKGDKVKMMGGEWSMDEAKLLGTATGLSVGKLAGGDAVAEMRYLDRERADALHDVLPDVRDAMRRGDEDEAEKLLGKAGLDDKEISRTLKNLDDPSKISKGRMKRFERHATDEQMDRLDKMRK